MRIALMTTAVAGLIAVCVACTPTGKGSDSGDTAADPNTTSPNTTPTNTGPTDPGTTDTDTNDTVPTGSCGVFCGFAPGASPTQASCVDDTFADLGYDLSGPSCAAITDNNAACLACVVEIGASDADCYAVTETCVTE